jgi:hypothetical protein
LWFSQRFFQHSRHSASWGALQRAPVNTSKHTQLFSHVYSQLSDTNCTAMCMLVCNIHYCRLAIQSTSKSV